MAKYAINVRDARIVFATQEVSENPSYFVLHDDTVRDIQAGRLSAKDAVAYLRLRGRTVAEAAPLRAENVRQVPLPQPEPNIVEDEGVKVPGSAAGAGDEIPPDATAGRRVNVGGMDGVIEPSADGGVQVPVGAAVGAGALEDGAKPGGAKKPPANKAKK